MYEDNDLYNLDLGDNEGELSQDANEQTADPAEPREQAEQKEQAKPNRADDKANTGTSPEPQRSQDSAQTTTQLSHEQLDYIERGRQREALILMCDNVKQRIPDFDFEKIAPQILKMQPQQAKEYLSPLGLETLWLRSFGLSSHAVDGGREPSYDMNDIMDKMRKGEANDDEELEFYKELGRISRG